MRKRSGSGATFSLALLLGRLTRFLSSTYYERVFSETLADFEAEHREVILSRRRARIIRTVLVGYWSLVASAVMHIVSQALAFIRRSAVLAEGELPRTPESRRLHRENLALRAIASVLFVATLTLAVLFLHLRQAVRGELSSPVSAQIFDLMPADFHTRGDESPAVLTISEKTAHLVLILNTVDTKRFPRYRAELLGEESAGAYLWSHGGLHPDEYGALSIAVPPGFLAAGEYRINLYGVSTDDETFLGQAVDETFLEQYRFALTQP